MITINRTRERIKQTGEIFTPLPLVDEILDKLPPELFKDPTKTFIDPACGDGNFLVRVVAYKIANGLTAEQALSTTYGIDLMEDNVSHARGRVLTHAWLASEYYKHYPNEIIDYITIEDERKAGMMKDHDPFARKYNDIVEHNIIQGNTLELDFSEDWPPKPK